MYTSIEIHRIKHKTIDYGFGQGTDCRIRVHEVRCFAGRHDEAFAHIAFVDSLNQVGGDFVFWKYEGKRA